VGLLSARQRLYERRVDRASPFDPGVNDRVFGLAPTAQAPAELAEERADLGVLREPTLLLLREDQLTVGEHVVLALRALFDRGFVLRLGVQLGRETRGPCVVAFSDGAVLDQDLGHAENLPASRSS
jgi:hypothetical protein